MQSFQAFMGDGGGGETQKNGKAFPLGQVQRKLEKPSSDLSVKVSIVKS